MPPQYSLSVTYVRSSNGGKSLLGKALANDARGYNAFFDGTGVMDQDRFETWVGELVGRVMESTA